MKIFRFVTFSSFRFSSVCSLSTQVGGECWGSRDSVPEWLGVSEGTHQKASWDLRGRDGLGTQQLRFYPQPCYWLAVRFGRVGPSLHPNFLIRWKIFFLRAPTALPDTVTVPCPSHHSLKEENYYLHWTDGESETQGGHVGACRHIPDQAKEGSPLQLWIPKCWRKKKKSKTLISVISLEKFFSGGL